VRYNAAVCVSGDGVLGRHRKVHQPPGEIGVYAPGEGFAAFDTPAGRVGMLIDYDKTFPESARSLALTARRSSPAYRRGQRRSPTAPRAGAGPAGPPVRLV